MALCCQQVVQSSNMAKSLKEKRSSPLSELASIFFKSAKTTEN